MFVSNCSLLFFSLFAFNGKLSKFYSGFLKFYNTYNYKFVSIMKLKLIAFVSLLTKYGLKPVKFASVNSRETNQLRGLFATKLTAIYATLLDDN